MKHLLSAPLEFLHDFHGGKSSKRFWGNRLLTIGVLLALGIYVANPLVYILFHKALPQSVHDNCYQVALMFMGAGGGLLFGGIFERLGGKKC